MQTLNGARFNDIAHKYGSLSNNTFYVTRDAFYISLTPSKSDPFTMRLQAKQVNFGFTSELFTNKAGFLIESRGSIEAQIKDANLDATIRLTTWKGDDRNTFAIIVESANVQLPSGSMDLTIHENIFAKVAEPFRAIYEAELRSSIEKQIEQIILKAFPRSLNRKIRQMQVPSEIDKYYQSHYQLDWGVEWLRVEKCDPVCYLIGLKGFQESVNEGGSVTSWKPQGNQVYLEKFYDRFSQQPSSSELSSIFNDAEASLLIPADLRETVYVRDVFNMIFSKIDHTLFGLFKVHTLGSYKMTADGDIDFQYLSLQPFAPQWLPQHTTQRLPKMSDKGYFYTEKLKSGRSSSYSRTLTRPIGDMVHLWISQHYDNFGIVKLLEKMYLPWIYWIFGEKMP